MHSSDIETLRQAGPYINAHRHKICVVYCPGEAIADSCLAKLIHDVALLHSLGLRIVLVHGARPQIETRLQQAGHPLRYANGLRITDEAVIDYIKEAVGQVRIHLEAQFSMGLTNTPGSRQGTRVIAGNFLIARPLGIREGIDYCFTGEVRRIDSEAIHWALEHDAIVLLSPLGYSPSGETFNLSAEEVATASAIDLGAEKLVLLGEDAGLHHSPDQLLRQLSLNDAEQLLNTADHLGEEAIHHLQQAIRACRGGVRRVHLLSWKLDGALIMELLSRDGVGSLITIDVYEGIRPAIIDDIGGILALIEPLEADGTLVRRSRELLEMEIDRFIILERDGAIIGCAALYPFPKEGVGELACVAVDPAYRDSGRASHLLQFLENRGRQLGLKRLFVLTTQAAHWFQERSFTAASITELPIQKQTLYNLQRRSKIFSKKL